jgi:uncharacterized radical SAM superfamily protein
VGAIPTVCVFRPLVGTDYSNLPPPETEPLVPVFRRLYESCMERGLPIGCAPDVHVSLVLLPEEARTLSDRRFPLREMRRRSKAALAGRFLRARMAGYDRRHASA